MLGRRNLIFVQKILITQNVQETISEKTFRKGEFLGNLFSDDSYIDLEKQGVFYDSINGADDLASQRYGNHNDYLVIDCNCCRKSK